MNVVKSYDYLHLKSTIYWTMDINGSFNEMTFKPKVLHLGYFGSWNCGDDVFVQVFQYLNRINPYYEAHFQDQGENYPVAILGGGDVINPYFMKELDNVRQRAYVAFGIGLPYLDQLSTMERFNQIVLRNTRDLSLVKYVFPKKDVRVLPDLAWLMSWYYQPQQIIPNRGSFTDRFVVTPNLS